VKTIASTGDVLSKAKAINETVNRSRTEIIRTERLEHLAGLYASDSVIMNCDELKEYRTLEIRELKA